jgi:type III restriction enzyme
MRVTRAGVNVSQGGVSAGVMGMHSQDMAQMKRKMDIVGMIKRETKLTRKTIVEILSRADNVRMFLENPERFCFEVVRIIKEELTKKSVEQVRYEIVPETYSSQQFEDIPAYKDSIQPIAKSIYNAIVYDSDVEKEFALKLNEDERITLFIKLPNWFKVETPVGSYNPDWAIVTTKRNLQGKESKEKIYFVIETKGNLNNLRQVEQEKIASAKKHFEVIAVDYKEVESFDQFVSCVEE